MKIRRLCRCRSLRPGGKRSCCCRSCWDWSQRSCQNRRGSLGREPHPHFTKVHLQICGIVLSKKKFESSSPHTFQPSTIPLHHKLLLVQIYLFKFYFSEMFKTHIFSFFFNSNKVNDSKSISEYFVLLITRMSSILIGFKIDIL